MISLKNETHISYTIQIHKAMIFLQRNILQKCGQKCHKLQFCICNI